MEKTYYLDRLMESGEFRFDTLLLKDTDNSPGEKFHGSEILEQETCLFHEDVPCGDSYFEILHHLVYGALYDRKAAPVVRFADGEYAFYANSLHCNGLYQQAESIEAIRKAMPMHVDTLKILNRSGILAPLIYPGNVRARQHSFFTFIGRRKRIGPALKFTEFLFSNNIELTKSNYLPFYVVYAYLTSKQFSGIVDGKKICIISSECNVDSCRQWFARFSSRPNIIFTEIPDSYVATQWESIKDDILSSVPNDTDLCLVGAGIGALLVCVDVAQEFSIPALDAGHVLNMINGLEGKSDGPRLYTIHNE